MYSNIRKTKRFKFNYFGVYNPLASHEETPEKGIASFLSVYDALQKDIGTFKQT